MGKISGLILAAGRSRRLGANKLLLPVGRKTVIERVVESYLFSDLGEIIMVTGYQADLVKEKISYFLQEPRFRLVENRNYQWGMSTSIKAALPFLHPSAEAVMIGLADQPLITRGLINELLSCYASPGKRMIVPYFQGQRGHPVIVDLAFREEMKEIEGDTGLRGLLDSHPEEIFIYETEDPSVTLDLDTREDYQRLLSLFEGQESFQGEP